MFDFGLYTQVSASGPHGPLVFLDVLGLMVLRSHGTHAMNEQSERGRSWGKFMISQIWFLAHLSHRLRVSYCHWPVSVVRRPSCVVNNLL